MRSGECLRPSRTYSWDAPESDLNCSSGSPVGGAYGLGQTVPAAADGRWLAFILHRTWSASFGGLEDSFHRAQPHGPIPHCCLVGEGDQKRYRVSAPKVRGSPTSP